MYRLLVLSSIFWQLQVNAQSITIVNRVNYNFDYWLEGYSAPVADQENRSQYIGHIPANAVIRWSNADSIQWKGAKPLCISSFGFPTGTETFSGGVNIKGNCSRMTIPAAGIYYCWIQATDTSDITVVIELTALKDGEPYHPYSAQMREKYSMAK